MVQCFAGSVGHAVHNAVEHGWDCPFEVDGSGMDYSLFLSFNYFLFKKKIIDFISADPFKHYRLSFILINFCFHLIYENSVLFHSKLYRI